MRKCRVAKSRQRASRLLGMIATRRSHSDRRRGCFQAPCRAAKTAERGARGTGTPAGLRMSKATLDGAPIAIEDAYQHAAKILGGAKFPVVAGLGDRRGRRARRDSARRAAARRLSTISRRDEIFNDLDVTRSFGMFVTTPTEARVRADVVLLVGPGLTEHWPALFERLALGEPARFNDASAAQGLVARPQARRGQGRRRRDRDHRRDAARTCRACSRRFAPASAAGRSR